MAVRIQSVKLECSCASHDAMKLDPRVIALMPFVGWQKVPGERLELRNCPACGSTLCTAVYQESEAHGEGDQA